MTCDKNNANSGLKLKWTCNLLLTSSGLGGIGLLVTIFGSEGCSGGMVGGIMAAVGRKRAGGGDVVTDPPPPPPGPCGPRWLCKWVWCKWDLGWKAHCLWANLQCIMKLSILTFLWHWPSISKWYFILKTHQKHKITSAIVKDIFTLKTLNDCILRHGLLIPFF